MSCFTSGLISCLTQIERDEGLWHGVARLRKEALSADIERGCSAESFGSNKTQEATSALLLGYRGDRPY